MFYLSKQVLTQTPNRLADMLLRSLSLCLGGPTHAVDLSKVLLVILARPFANTVVFP